MKITTGEVKKIFILMPELMAKRLPSKVGYAISKNMKNLKSIAESYEEEHYKLIERYGKRDENGKLIKPRKDRVDLEDAEGYVKELKELEAIENEVEIHMIDFEALERCDESQFDALSPSDLDALDFMLK